ncbi:wax ester/triacylglycerol synthase family O-acyltransferase [Paraconexibacter algicola]|uniref:Diacylglycerol O-acyltransferase n=1 Tax=Paraconexibacter algicola TaxID=2133960 RepID=A0A2T4UMR5_9ACTN|nr:wax ester/triacylglycerol synthase family O-acyltransferase [Paraconexibacter algicola]PTL60514.1 hypothetical protein C7Y72_13140 [Paraconexibacter algicola]
MPRSRLSTLDASFFRVETASAHMHVAWKGRFAPRADGRPVTIEALRASVSARLRYAERFRQRVAFPPAGFGEPVWIDDERFDIAAHVVPMSAPDEPLSRARFDELVDRCLSTPLDRTRALWRIELAPQLEDGTIGMVMKIHHAMVDGKSAVELALLLLDVSADADHGDPDEWTARAAPGPTRLALEALADGGLESLRAAGGLARMARSGPGGLRSGVRLADTLRRAALSVGEDVLKPAPSSYVNRPITAHRALVHHTTAIGPLLDVKRRHGVTLNDVALCVVSGALRELSMRAGRVPAPLKVMVPVSTRAAEEAGDLGNRISFVFVELPVQLHRPAERLAAIHAETSRFKDQGRAGGGETLMGALGVLPEPLKEAAARLAASPRTYNLTVSNVPGPRMPVYLLGAELIEAAPVIPITDGHALSIGIFTVRDEVTFSVYLDPTALPQALELPQALSAAALEVGAIAGPRRARSADAA